VSEDRQPYEQVTGRVAAATGAHPMTRDEADALLLLAKTVADASGDRRAAPLTCYLAGQILAEEGDPQARVARIRALAEELARPDEQ
jgi:Cdc6-like AAA superfamily ATPase